MKTTKIILVLTVTTASLFLLASITAAHSEHDHSQIPLQWKFSKKVEGKIQSRGVLQDNKFYIGLSSHEQDTMEYYGIRSGNIFTTQVNGVHAYIKRTSTGIQIMDGGAMDIAMKKQLPIRPLSWASLASTGSTSHSGHDHSLVPIEWSFGESTQDRIAGRLDSKKWFSLASPNSSKACCPATGLRWAINFIRSSTTKPRWLSAPVAV